RHGEEHCVIQGIFSRMEKEENIYCGISRSKKKQFRRNKKDYQKLSEHIGLIPVVMISPADTELIHGGSEERRRFIDGVIAQYSKSYLENLIQYNRALTQRNRLLKDFAARRNFQPDLLEAWDEQLILYGTPVFEERVRFVEDLLPVFDAFYRRVSEDREQVSLHYESPLHGTDFRTGLQEAMERDRVLQFSGFGIHKDDLGMQLGEHRLKKIGSQGQQKTFLVALKLAEFEFIRKITGISPLLLLDDIFDKFDGKRVRQIIGLVAEHGFGQIFISDTSASRMEEILREIPAAHRMYHIDSQGVLKNKDVNHG
ncbi:MAG: DNA replication and repair protein RecF, partial [Bacteroidales bacterium]